MPRLLFYTVGSCSPVDSARQDFLLHHRASDSFRKGIALLLECSLSCWGLAATEEVAESSSNLRPVQALNDRAAVNRPFSQACKGFGRWRIMESAGGVGISRMRGRMMPLAAGQCCLFKVCQAFNLCILPAGRHSSTQAFSPSRSSETQGNFVVRSGSSNFWSRR